MPEILRTTLLDLLARYFAANPTIRSERTRTYYRRAVRQFGEHLGRPATLADLDDEAIIGWTLAIASSACEVTANQRAKQLRALWEWAARRRLVEQFPTFKRLREPEPMPVAWSDNELHLLFAG